MQKALSMSGWQTVAFGLRPQRQQVYEVLLDNAITPPPRKFLSGPNAPGRIFRWPTVYNCLTALVQCGPGPAGKFRARSGPVFARTCRRIAIFNCDGCEKVFDINLPAKAGIPLPNGFKAERYDIAIHGRCPGLREQQTMSYSGRGASRLRQF